MTETTRSKADKAKRGDAGASLAIARETSTGALIADDAPPPAKSGNVVEQALKEPGTLQRLLCAGLAWTVTVGPLAFSTVGTMGARVLAILAIACGLVGPALAVRHRQTGRHVGISLFLLFSTGAWLLTPLAIDPNRIDSIRAAIGAVAWGVYALSWGEPWTAFGAPEKKAEIVDPMLAPLRARATLAPFAVPIATVGVVAAIIAMLGVWQIHDPTRAVIAQTAGVAVSVALVSASATIAVSRGKARASSDRKLTSPVVRALVLLVAVAVLGAVVLALRGS